VDKTDLKYLKLLGDNLRKRRLLEDISQNQLSFETGLSREYINRLENGKVNVSYLTLKKLCTCLSWKLKICSSCAL